MAIEFGLMKKKLRSKTSLIKGADQAFSLFIRARDGHCVLTETNDCASNGKGRLCNGHMIKRGKWTTRFDEMNCNTLCFECNYRDNNYPHHYVNWFLKKYGQVEFDRLYIQSKEVMDKRMGSLRSYLLDIEMTYTNKYRELDLNQPADILDVSTTPAEW